jgi:hypothetical protein
MADKILPPRHGGYKPKSRTLEDPTRRVAPAPPPRPPAGRGAGSSSSKGKGQ